MGLKHLGMTHIGENNTNLYGGKYQALSDVAPENVALSVVQSLKCPIHHLRFKR